MHKHIKDVLFDGFAAQSAKEGETVDLIVRDFVTSDSLKFFIYAEQIGNIIFPKMELSPDGINRYLMILHSDHSADIYLQDFQVVLGLRLNRTVSAGEAIFKNDISSIDNVQFPETSISEDDQIIYLERKGWRFGIAFDLTRKISIQDIGVLCAELHRRLLFDNILQITLSEFHKAEKTNSDAFIITEGKTDWRHLEKAFSEIGYRRKLHYDKSDQDRGDSKLLEICHLYSLEPRNRPVICIFDRDNDTILKRLNDADPDNTGYQDWGNNVYSLAIPVPKHREQHSFVSIEMYYTDKLLSRVTPDGRRLCFDNEVKQEVIQNKVTRSILLSVAIGSEESKKIVSKDIDFIEDEAGRKVGLSKSRFAEMIRGSIEPFTDVDFSSFQLIAETIDLILAGSK